MYKKGGLVKSYYENRMEKTGSLFCAFSGGSFGRDHEFGQADNLFLTVGVITDCEIVRISADVLRKLAMENIEIALVCNRMQSVASMREYEYRKMILTCNPVQRYEYFLETYPGLEKKGEQKRYSILSEHDT
mgnify:CR=1 FL=1